ncbi:ANTAR domain-containing protein [Catenulispora rubra]|uniref:ANTAR domain-containing protein n=1 Tax=Catenulispora rubra TaxID=280293 RepID=UPI0018927D66|nr:ANTAR domain-containing protein [Catenulispora rubra]
MLEPTNGSNVKDTGIIDTSAVIDQASGVLSVQLDMPIPEAMEWMRWSACVHGQLVAEFAADVVARRLSFGVGDRES